MAGGSGMGAGGAPSAANNTMPNFGAAPSGSNISQISGNSLASMGAGTGINNGTMSSGFGSNPSAMLQNAMGQQAGMTGLSSMNPTMANVLGARLSQPPTNALGGPSITYPPMNSRGGSPSPFMSRYMPFNRMFGGMGQGGYGGPRPVQNFQPQVIPTSSQGAAQATQALSDQDRQELEYFRSRQNGGGGGYGGGNG